MLQDFVSGQDKLANQVHQVIEQRNINPDGRVAGGTLASLFLDRLVDRFWSGCSLIGQDLANLAVITEVLLGGGDLNIKPLGSVFLDEDVTESWSFRGRWGCDRFSRRFRWCDISRGFFFDGLPVHIVRRM